MAVCRRSNNANAYDLLQSKIAATESRHMEMAKGMGIAR